MSQSPTAVVLPRSPPPPPYIAMSDARLYSPAQPPPRRAPPHIEPTDPVASSSSTPSSEHFSSSTLATTPSTLPHGHAQRTWRQTPNVPEHMQRRHHLSTISPITGQHEDRNRWLSEDEGTGPSSTAQTVNRRRRRNDHRDAHDRLPGVHSTAIIDRPKPPDRDKIVQSRLPRPARVLSPEPPRVPSQPSASASTPVSGGIGGDPPRILDIVRPPSNVAQVFSTASTGGEQPQIDPHRAPTQTSSSGPAAMRSQFGPPRGDRSVKDNPSGSDSEGSEGDRETSIRRDLLQRLRRILSWYVVAVKANADWLRSVLCPSVHGVQPPLHHPITLPCGHTLSADHIPIPIPAPLDLPPGTPAHDVYAAQQKHHEQRLSLWASVMCPMPGCKRYSPNAAISGVGRVVRDMSYFDIDPVETARLPARAERGENLPSGVMYYPPAQPAPPAYSIDPPVTVTGSPLLDVNVDKIIHLIQRELDILDGKESHPAPADVVDVAETSEQSDATPSSPSSSIEPKRRRHFLGLGGSAVLELTFDRELMGLLECDVCALLLYEPVTTPCQHVSESYELSSI